MKRLKITISGPAKELCVGKFQKDIADWMLEYCEEFKPLTDIEEVWYGDELFPIDWTNGKDSYEFDDVFHEFGFAFEDVDEIQEFLNDDLLQPAIEVVSLNDEKIKYDLSKTITHYQNINLPTLNENEVFAYHGYIYDCSLDYIVDVEHNLDENLINFHFVYCGEYGHILTKIDYNSKKMERVYSNTNIQVKSKWVDRIRENLELDDTLAKLKEFLSVKFTVESSAPKTE